MELSSFRLALLLASVIISSSLATRILESNSIAPCAPGGISVRQKFCDQTLSFEERASALYDALNTSERIGQLGMVAVGASRPKDGVAFSSLNMGGEALHGLWSTCVDGLCPTQFPSPLHLGASFNKDIWHAVGNISSIEARAIFATGQGKSLEGTLGLTYYTPNINLLRDPRWGRAEEVPSEDPLVNGAYGHNFVAGFQGDMKGYRRANAVVKHGFVYNLEVDTDPNDAQAGVDRHHFNAIVRPRELMESYLSQFKDVVSQADPAAIMCSYNAINGVPSCLNAPLLDDMLRRNFGFTGVIASDCGAITDAFQNHNYTASLEDAAKQALEATCDSNCGSAYQKTIPQMVASGKLKETDFQANVIRVLESRLRLGLFDGITTFDVPLNQVDSIYHENAALQAAREGIVLLQNNGGILPLKRTASIALIGPQANATRNMLSGYHGSPPFLKSPLDAIKKASGAAVMYARGVNISGYDTSMIAEVVMSARKADVVVLGIGLCGNNYISDADDTCEEINESEGIDRKNTSLPFVQRALINALLHMDNRPPIVVFVMAAGSIDLTMLKGQKNVSILWVVSIISLLFYYLFSQVVDCCYFFVAGIPRRVRGRSNCRHFIWECQSFWETPFHYVPPIVRRKHELRRHESL